MKLFKAKKILNIVIGIVITITSLVMFIQSFQKYSDEYGTDISFNSDYVITLLIGIIVLTYGIVTFSKEITNYSNISGMMISFLLGTYLLGTFLKSLNKAIIDSSTKFDFVGNQLKLYIGIIAILTFIFYLISYRNEKIKN